MTAPQLPGFEDHTITGRHHPDTSRLAALDVLPRTGTQRRRVYDYILRSGGATDFEIQNGLGISGNTERPRRVELVDGGLVADYGRRRREAGRLAIIWTATR